MIEAVCQIIARSWHWGSQIDKNFGAFCCFYESELESFLKTQASLVRRFVLLMDAYTAIAKMHIFLVTRNFIVYTCRVIKSSLLTEYP